MDNDKRLCLYLSRSISFGIHVLGTSIGLSQVLLEVYLLFILSIVGSPLDRMSQLTSSCVAWRVLGQKINVRR